MKNLNMCKILGRKQITSPDERQRKKSKSQPPNNFRSLVFIYFTKWETQVVSLHQIEKII